MSGARRESVITSITIYLANALDEFHASSSRESTGFGAAPERWLTSNYTFRGCAIEDMCVVNFPVLIFSREFRDFAPQAALFGTNRGLTDPFPL